MSPSITYTDYLRDFNEGLKYYDLTFIGSKTICESSFISGSSKPLMFLRSHNSQHEQNSQHEWWTTYLGYSFGT